MHLSCDYFSLFSVYEEFLLNQCASKYKSINKTFQICYRNYVNKKGELFTKYSSILLT